MDKEKILSGLKDLVQTLKSPNIKNEAVLEKWRIKAEEIQEEFAGLNSCDMLWLSEEYSKWHKEEVAPELDGGLAELASYEHFPWI